MEFGIVAHYSPGKQAGLIQASEDDVVFFWARDARYLKLDETANRIVFTNPREHVPALGDLVVFERAKFYGTIPEIEYKARVWGGYSTWLVLHGVQMVNLKRMLRKTRRSE